LPIPPGPGQGDEADVVPTQQRADGRQLVLSANKGIGLDGEVGRVEPEARERREAVAQARGEGLVDALRLEQVAQPVLAEVAERDAGGEVVVDQLAGGLGEEDLAAVAGREQAGEPVEAGGEVVAGDRGGDAGMEGEADPERARSAPGLGGQRPLGGDGGGEGVGGRGEGGLDRVADGLEAVSRGGRRPRPRGGRGGGRRRRASPPGRAPRAGCCPRRR
jgi:hypothetical protein